MPAAILPDLSSLDTFGAPKKDFGESIDPESECPAAEYNRIAAMLVSLGFAVPRARVTVSSAGALLSFKSVWGASPVPTIAKPGTGQYTVTMPSSVADPLGEAHAFAVEATGVHSNTASRVANSRNTNNVVTVDTLNAVGGAAADGAFTLLVY